MVALTSLLALIGATTSLVQAIPVERNNDKSDACQRMIGNIAAYKPSTVLACLKSIPFSEQVRQNVMGTVTAMYGISIFQYNQLGDDEPALNQGIDVIKEFARINSSTYSSDYEFQSDLSQVMYSLNDGHHAWVNCYQTAFGTSHYIPIVAIGDGASEKASIYIAPDVETFVAASGVGQFYGSLGIDPTVLAGAKVLKVEGKDVWEYLDNVAIPGAGTYQDPEQRLTSLFSGYSASGFGGAIARQPGGFTVAQDFAKDNITLSIQLASGEKGDVTVPWLTQWLGSGPFQYPTGVDLFNGICTFSDNDTPPPVAGNTTETGTNTTDPTTTQQPAEGSETANSTMTIDEAAQELYASCPKENFARYQLADQYNPLLSTSYLGGRDIQFYTLRNDSSVGVMYVPTFSPEGNNTLACRNRYVYDAYLGLRNLTQAGVTKLLIDTSNNGGGNIALTQWLQRLITGEKYLSYVNFQSLLRKAPLSEALVDAHIANPDAESGSFSPSYFRNGGNGSLVDLSNSTDFFEPGQQRTINGQTLYTSNPISDSLDNIVEYDEIFSLSDEAPFPPMDVVFTGNGLCGSSCSSFTNFLIEYYNATAYVSAARPANDIEFQSFAAGQVTNSGNLYEEAKAVGLNDTTLLPELIIRGTFSFALRAALSPNIAPGEFLQYRRFPAQNRYSLTFDQYNDIIGNWEYVASKVFNKA